MIDYTDELNDMLVKEFPNIKMVEKTTDRCFPLDRNLSEPDKTAEGMERVLLRIKRAWISTIEALGGPDNIVAFLPSSKEFSHYKETKLVYCYLDGDKLLTEGNFEVYDNSLVKFKDISVKTFKGEE